MSFSVEIYKKKISYTKFRSALWQFSPGEPYSATFTVDLAMHKGKAVDNSDGHNKVLWY